MIVSGNNQLSGQVEIIRCWCQIFDIVTILIIPEAALDKGITSMFLSAHAQSTGKIEKVLGSGNVY